MAGGRGGVTWPGERGWGGGRHGRVIGVVDVKADSRTTGYVGFSNFSGIDCWDVRS